MELDSAGLEVLSLEECLTLLDSVPIGRIVFTDRALPAVQPVNFVRSDGYVIIRTVPGSKLAAAARNAVVAFEVDDFDPVNGSGWSVTVIGHAQRVHDPDDVARLARLPLRPWAPGRHDHFIRITPEYVTGRRVPAMVSPAAGSATGSPRPS